MSNDQNDHLPGGLGDGEPSLVGLYDPPPFTRLNENATAPVLLICDHASREIPASLDNLGVDPAALQLHIAWDIGAGEITRRLAEKTGWMAVLAGYSRLVIDLNRQPGDPTAMPEVSDNIPVPGNQGLSEGAKIERTDEIFWPYHHAVSDALDHLWRLGTPPVLLSIHTFTPSLNGEDRVWDIGVLWNRDPRVARELIRRLGDHPRGLHVGDNQPYSGREIAYSLDLHAGAAGLPHCAVEIRQDLADSNARAQEWADTLAEVVSEILTADGLHTVEHF